MGARRYDFYLRMLRLICSDQNGLKTLSSDATYTYIIHVMEYLLAVALPLWKLLHTIVPVYKHFLKTYTGGISQRWCSG